MNQISSEFKIPKILDYLPVVSTFTGLVRLFMLAHQKTQARQGVLVAKVSKSWGDQTGKRGAIALIPVIGNLILGIHDLKKSAKDRMINNIVNSEKELIENLELTDKIVNPFIKDWDEFDKELSTIVYPAICSEKKLLSGAGMKVQIYDAYACFLSEKVYRKSTLEDYQLQTYIKYACCIARLLKCQNNHSSMLNQINSLGDLEQIQELFTKFDNFLREDKVYENSTNASTKSIITELEQGFLSYFMKLSDVAFREEILDKKSRLTKFIQNFSHPIFLQFVTKNSKNALIYNQIRDFLFQKVYHALLDENHPIYGQENLLLKSEGFVVENENFKFIHPNLQAYFCALDEFMGNLGVEMLVDKLERKVYDFDMLRENVREVD